MIWGLETFHYFTCDKSCTIHTDHKPLETIFKKKLSNCPARSQRFVLQALKYDVTVKCVKRTEVPIADALSRVSPQPAPPEGEFPQLDIHQVTKNLPASTIKLQQIRHETANDPTLSKLRDVIHEGWPATKEKCPKALHNYWNFREELTIEDGLILKQEQIVMPTMLRHDTLNTIHYGHLGQEKCLLRARSAVFWPGITRDVTSLVHNYHLPSTSKKTTEAANPTAWTTLLPMADTKLRSVWVQRKPIPPDIWQVQQVSDR